MSDPPAILATYKQKERWSKMTTLEKTNIGKALNISGALENRILHDWNNGGAKSTYGLSVYQRKALLRILISESPKCFCVNCLEVK
jgi:hypothetical protein